MHKDVTLKLRFTRFSASKVLDLASIDASECYISLFLNISKYAKLMLIVQNISHNLIVVQDYRQTRFLFKL